MKYLVIGGLLLMFGGAAKAQDVTKCYTPDGHVITCTTTHQTTPTDIGNSIVQAQVAANAAPPTQSIYAQRRDECKARGNGWKWHPWKGLYGSCEVKK
jgi:hypothetical protein